MPEPIGRDEAISRLVALCIGGSSGLPKRARDLQILLAASTLWMEQGAVYEAAEVNEMLSQWLEEGCPSLQVDVVTLRRLLVDHLYLDRDDSGRHYSPGPGPIGWQFANDLATFDPIEAIARERSEREARKSRHLAGSNPDDGGPSDGHTDSPPRNA